MTVLELWQTGFISEALATQQSLAGGEDEQATLLYFEMLAAVGKLKSASAVLHSITRIDDDWVEARQNFLSLLRAEMRRRSQQLNFFQEPVPNHAKHRRASLRVEPELGLKHVDRADAFSPTVGGHVDGREFHELRDVDDCFASVLEVIVGTRPLLVPWEQVRTLKLHAVAGVLDEVYRPATLRTSQGEEFSVHVPLVYALSFASGPSFALGRDSERVRLDNGVVRGVGGKMLFTTEEEFLLSECKQIDVSAVT